MGIFPFFSSTASLSPGRSRWGWCREFLPLLIINWDSEILKDYLTFLLHSEESRWGSHCRSMGISQWPQGCYRSSYYGPISLRMYCKITLHPHCGSPSRAFLSLFYITKLYLNGAVGYLLPFSFFKPEESGFLSLKILSLTSEELESSCLTQISQIYVGTHKLQEEKHLVNEGLQEEGRMVYTQGWPQRVCACPGVQHISSTYSRQMKSLGSSETWIQMCQPEHVKTAA